MPNQVSVDRAFSDWLVKQSLADREGHADLCYSIAIESPCTVCQPRIALKLAAYLDEYDDEYNSGGWFPVTDHRFEQLQAYADFRRMLGRLHADDQTSAIEFLSSKGGVILELPKCHRETQSNRNVFQVSMSCKEPEENSHHLWLNAKRIPDDSLIPMIANAFFDWASKGGDRPQSA
ncbi:MAG: hypothetical protein ACSHYF_09250 [Verrucomicrobiaceae bacterium]